MSRFVSAGSEDNPSEQDEAWLKAQEAIEATRKKKPQVGGQQEGGRSLYETLQANKAAKQEQFEESIKLRNQFRSLDEDEVEFLDSVLESTREQEAAVKRQTKEQLDAFRQQREEAERAAKLAAGTPEAANEAEQTSWAVGRKRKKPRNDVFGAVKLRKASTSDKSPAQVESEDGTAVSPTADPSPKGVQEATKPSADTAMPSEHSMGINSGGKDPSPATTSAGLGLGVYSSDEDD